jgi:hypothetical protein
LWRFGPERDEIIPFWGTLHNEMFHNLYSSPNIVGMIKSWRKRWAGHVARTEELYIQIFVKET